MKNMKLLMVMVLCLLAASVVGTTVNECDFESDLCDWVESDDSVVRVEGVTYSESFSGDGWYMMLYNDNDTESNAIATLTFNKGSENITEESGFKLTYDVVKVEGSGTLKMIVYDGLTAVKVCTNVINSAQQEFSGVCSFRDAGYTDLTVKVMVVDNEGDSVAANVFIDNFVIEYDDFFSNVDTQGLLELIVQLLPLLLVMRLVTGNGMLGIGRK